MNACVRQAARTFSGNGTGGIVNRGTINAADGGYVALLGNTVVNQGTISAQLGTVALGAGSAATLTFSGNSLVQMQVDQSTLNNLAENGGLIRAEGGTVLMSAGAKNELLASVVNNTGVIEARTVENQEGTIILLGGMTAGTANVGGRLDASAPNGGNGGFIETSAAHVNIADAAKITTLASNGKTGTWLIDPTDYTIAAVDPANGSSYMSNATLATSLGSGNVTIATLSAGAGNGDIFVNDVVSWNSANSLTLNAIRNVNVNAAITNAGAGGLTLNSDSGITINQNLTTAGITTLNADKNNDGTGTLTVANNITVATTNSALNVTAADVALVSFGALNSGTAPTSITASANRSIGLGGTAGDLTLTNTEMNHLTASSLTLNTTSLAGDVTVNGITSGGNNSGPVTLNAGGTVTFATAASSFFKGVTVNANDGVAVSADISASNGNIVLDGDANSTATPGDGIVFTATRILTAATDYGVSQDPTQGAVILRNGSAGTNGNIASAALTLNAKNGVTIADDLTATGGDFTANVNLDGQVPFFTGTFTVASGKTVATATSGNIIIEASDIALDGDLQSAGAVTLDSSYNIFTGLGASVQPGGFNLSDAELGRISATGLTIGVDTRGLNEILVGGVTAANTDQFGPLTLTTTGTIHFENTSVVGNSLSANADGGIVFLTPADLSTSDVVNSAPNLSLTGNNIAFNTSVTATAGGTGTLSLTTTGSLISNGNLTLESGDDLVLNYNLSSPGILAINADKNNDGTGTFTVANAVTVGTTGAAHPINLTAADVLLAGTGAINTGVSETFITASAGRSIGLGATTVAGGLNLDGGELQKITATGLTMTSAGNITVDGITEPNSNNVSAITTLTANGGSSTVAFGNTASTFNALTVNSSTTIANNATLTLDVGNLVLNAGTDITQTGAIEIGAHTANLTGAVITLDHASNTLGAVTVNSDAGDVSLREDEAINIAGITRAGGNLTLNAGTADITQTGAIAIGTGTANFTAGNITLSHASNVLGAVSVNAGTGNIALTENDAIAITGISHTGTLGLTANGSITDSGATVVSGTTTLAAGTTNDITLDNANDFSTVVVTSGKNVTLNDLNGLALGNVTAAGALLATAAGGLTLNSGATIAATGAVANPLVLVAGGNFVNNAGATALNADSGRWLVYSTSPAGSTENGLTALASSPSPRLYNRTFAGNAPATIVAGNHLIYSAQPTLTVTADDKTRAYGDANPTFTATATGFVSDDGVTDTPTTAGLAGAAALTSLATATSSVTGSSPLAITPAVGDLASSAGYGFSFVDGGLTITARPVTITATPGQTKVYGSADPSPLIFAYTSLGSGVALSGSLTRVAGESVLGGPYAVTQGTLTNANNSNYSLTYNGGTFAITPANLTLSGTRVYNGTTVFAGTNLTATGVNGETFAMGGSGGSDNLLTKNVQTGSTLNSVTGLTLGSGNTGTTISTNYNSFTTTGSSVSVTPKPITATGITASGKVYNANDVAIIDASSATLTNGATTDFDNKVYTGDFLTLNAGGATGVFTSNVFVVGKDVGANKDVTVSGLTLITGGDSGNYTLTGASGAAADIDKAHLTVTADDKSRLYGQANPALTTTVSGFVNGENAGTAAGFTGAGSATTTASATTPVGKAVITAGANTLAATNYDFTTLVDGVLTINPAALVLNSGAPPQAPEPVHIATSQIQSEFTLFNPIDQHQTLLLSPTIGGEANSYLKEVVVVGNKETRINIGGLGPILEIVNGGVRLPGNLVNENE